MNCDFVPASDEKRKPHVCQRCGFTTKPTGSKRVYRICDGWPRWWEWGYWASLVLAAIGLNKGRVGWLAWKLNLVEPGGCTGCEAREKWLNTLPGKIATLWRRIRG